MEEFTLIKIVQLLQQRVSVRCRLRDLYKLLVFRRDSVSFLHNRHIDSSQAHKHLPEPHSATMKVESSSFFRNVGILDVEGLRTRYDNLKSV